MREQKSWEEHEDKYLKTHYLTHSNQQMADSLDRSKCSIMHRVVFLKLGKQRQVKHQMLEDMQRLQDYLLKNGPTSRENLCKKLAIADSVMSGRLRHLQSDEIIETVRYGNNKLWQIKGKPMTQKTGMLELMQQRMMEEETRILEYLTQHGPTRKIELQKQLKIDGKVITNRCTSLKRKLKIKTEQRGVHRYWSLGEQKEFQSRKIPKKPEVINPESHLASMPEHIRKLFGMISFIPPSGRHIKESIPDIPLRKNSVNLGNGFWNHIDSMSS